MEDLYCQSEVPIEQEYDHSPVESAWIPEEHSLAVERQETLINDQS